MQNGLAELQETKENWIVCSGWLSEQDKARLINC
jgi:hypothetical protein